MIHGVDAAGDVNSRLGPATGKEFAANLHGRWPFDSGAAKTSVASAARATYIWLMEQGNRTVIIVRRALIVAVMAFIVFVFGAFAVNFYRNYQAGDGPQPGIIFERSDRPPRA